MYVKRILIALVMMWAVPASAGGLDDEALFAAFDQANSADISTARLGWQKAHAPEVRDLARMVVTDHMAVQTMGRQLAHDLGFIGAPSNPAKAAADHAATLQALNGHSGKAFDAAYLRHEIAFHTAVIDTVKTVMLPNIENPQFKNLVKNVLPGFEHHLKMSKVTADKLGVSY